MMKDLMQAEVEVILLIFPKPLSAPHLVVSINR